ncbi:class II aldolase/adducin family protein [Cohnella luojiensis]|uniref:Class II aldolase/adducin family protein n=1 Tax=Cohnella luojiensis TaxID=652876 RepID=A0A4Y8LRM2_9BACL|nr:class II aldolase/adducin family protein [Cohnella luojiensis]TFE23482.1 class II aldolase/adducin family protein [Cohnella luojiensis]
MNSFTITGSSEGTFFPWFMDGIKDKFETEGYRYSEHPDEPVRVVFQTIDAMNPRPFRRKAQATFVVSVMETHEMAEPILKAAYPFLIRSLSNHLVYICHNDKTTEIYFITPEQGCYKITCHSNKAALFQSIYDRLEPLASSELVIDNEFHSDLTSELWEGDEISESLRFAGKRLDGLNLLPAPFPIDQYLTPRDMRHLKKLYGIGGLSYGNLSSRKDQDSFWMSAAGANKADLKTIGQDILLVKGFNPILKAMQISVPPNLTPHRVSVDAIEHWMIYAEHPQVGAIIHIHAWIDGVQATEINYPCGTIQLARTVAELIRQSDHPERTIIGLKNHGLTITGPDLDDIFERIDGKILPQVPMV